MLFEISCFIVTSVSVKILQNFVELKKMFYSETNWVSIMQEQGLKISRNLLLQFLILSWKKFFDRIEVSKSGAVGFCTKSQSYLNILMHVQI